MSSVYLHNTNREISPQLFKENRPGIKLQSS